jgi:hypothetical protein
MVCIVFNFEYQSTAHDRRRQYARLPRVPDGIVAKREVPGRHAELVCQQDLHHARRKTDRAAWRTGYPAAATAT